MTRGEPPRRDGAPAAAAAAKEGSPERPLSRSPRTAFAGSALPGTEAAELQRGPRFRQAEAEIRSLKTGHAREITSLRTYIAQLLQYA